MAKNKSKHKHKAQQDKPVAPGKFLRENARKMPVGKCYVTPSDWQEIGMTHVIVTRQRPNGNLLMGTFLIDTFCTGLRATYYRENMTPQELEEEIDNYRRCYKVDEISYNEAHNLIYGAIAFAEDGGLECPGFFLPTGYILEEDTDDIPMIEYEFGKNGKHFFEGNPNNIEDTRALEVLKENLGDDLEYVMTDDEVYEFDEDSEDGTYESEENDDEEEVDPAEVNRFVDALLESNGVLKRYEDEIYFYKHPDYPHELVVKNQFIADELLSPDNYDYLPREVIDRILALPSDEAAQDLANLIFYVIGKTYRIIDDGKTPETEESAILHAVILLTQIQSEKGFEALLEIIRQDISFTDYHLGDFVFKLMHQALYACGRNNVPAIEEYLHQPGFNSYLREQAAAALAMIIENHPERRAEIIEVFQCLLVAMVRNLPNHKIYDATFAGLLMGVLMDINAVELIPEIKDVFATGCVDRGVSGDCRAVIESIEQKAGAVNDQEYKIPDIYTVYDEIKSFLEVNK